MSKYSVWLENSGDRVLVDVGSKAEQHWRAEGYAEPGLVVDAVSVIEDKAVKKTRGRKSVEA